MRTLAQEASRRRCLHWLMIGLALLILVLVAHRALGTEVLVIARLELPVLGGEIKVKAQEMFEELQGLGCKQANIIVSFNEGRKIVTIVVQCTEWMKGSSFAPGRDKR